MNAEIRVRLEGQLELVEQSVASLNTAFAALSTRAPTGLTETVEFDASPEVARAEQALRRLAALEPELTGTLETLEFVRRAFWGRVRERARELGAPAARPQAVLSLLEAAPIVFARTLFSKAIFLALAGAVLFTGLLWRTRVPEPLQFLPGVMFATAVLLTAAESARVVVTRERLVIRGEAFAFDSIRFMHVRGLQERTPFREVVVELALVDGRVVERRLPGFPRALEAALSNCGVPAQIDYWFGGISWSTDHCPLCAKRNS